MAMGRQDYSQEDKNYLDSLYKSKLSPVDGSASDNVNTANNVVGARALSAKSQQQLQ